MTMKKRLIIILFLFLLITGYSSAQPPPLETSPPAPKKSKTIRPVSTFAVTFLPTDTCILKIDGEERGEIVKSKTIKLPLNTYRLFFESLETGETVKKRFFRLTRDSLKDGKYTFVVVFSKSKMKSQ
jgi:hypothetical protein